MFTSLISTSTGTLTLQAVALCTAASAILGLFLAIVYRTQGETSKNFFIALVLLPVIVQGVIMMVSGNLGTAVAVAGTFSLVRFRSMAGTAREIVFIFFAMAIGLATGMGYVSFAALMAIAGSVIFVIINRIPFAEDTNTEKMVRVTVAEDLDYTNALDDVFTMYTKKHTLLAVKTTNMGSMYELRYRVTLRDAKKEKQFLDDLRVRNGNLTIVASRWTGNSETL